MNMFIPMKQGGGSDKEFLERLAKHFSMHYKNADNVIDKLNEIVGKMGVAKIKKAKDSNSYGTGKGIK